MRFLRCPKDCSRKVATFPFSIPSRKKLRSRYLKQLFFPTSVILETYIQIPYASIAQKFTSAVWKLTFPGSSASIGMIPENACSYCRVSTKASAAPMLSFCNHLTKCVILSRRKVQQSGQMTFEIMFCMAVVAALSTFAAPRCTFALLCSTRCVQDFYWKFQNIKFVHLK